ncbi:MAG: glucose 1-dehydrogenase [Acidobacteriota bacterium]
MKIDYTNDFSNKVVLITGGSTGIGRATALAFAQRGAAVSIGAQSEKSTETVAQIKKAGGRAIFVRTDVTRASDVEQLVKKTVTEFGGLHCAFNNAGALPPTQSLAEVDEDTFDKTISVDLKGVFLCLKYEIRYMVNMGGGAIVNMASVAGVVADPDMAPYVAAKHGVVGLTRSAALDYAKKGIRVNAVAPGLVESSMTRRWLADPDIRGRLLVNSPAGRAAQPEEISGMVLFLCSPAASFANGGVYILDGGQTAH